MKTALILGITGGFGGHVAEALAQQGWHIKALMRDTSKLPGHFGAVEAIAGDASRIEDVRRAVDATDVIIYGVNAPYAQWDTTVVPWLDVTARVAEERKLTIVFPGNVYVFDPEYGPNFNEQTPLRAVTAKGRLREIMEQRLHDASVKGARVIILRCGDFIGKHSPSSWLAHLIKPARAGYALSVTGPRTLKHTWAYLPDVARTVAHLLARREHLAAFDVFHFKGYCVTFPQIAADIASATGQRVILKRFPWWLLRAASPFSAWIRGLLQMRYLWNREINLEEHKLAQTLGGNVPHTPLPVALLESALVARSGVADAPKAAF